MNTARLAVMGAAAMLACAGFAHAATGPVSLVAAQPSGASIQVVGPRNAHIVAVSDIAGPSARSTWSDAPSQRESIYSTVLNSGRQTDAAEKTPEAPLPGALWLFASALLAFLGISARRRF
ncbi:hypothetical protein WG902_09835 [Ramlibacter sp. PS3R-8]|uniref:hypothetical protein n=1 Tax=Ramlibacter sp. PS3R-8 TaxID=3133437 RepID=UPI0030A43A15